MNNRFFAYLKREHARLDAEIEQASHGLYRDEVRIARLKRQKLAIKDQMASWSSDVGRTESA